MTTLFKEGDHPSRGLPVIGVRYDMYTLGVELANGTCTPCTAQGQAAQFIYGDSGVGTENGFAVPLHSVRHSGGRGVWCLAGGAVTAGADLIVKMVNFTIAGVVVSLPVAVAATDGVDGDVIFGWASMGSSASGADTDAFAPSLAVEFYDVSRKVVGGESAESFLTFHVDLADIAATGDVITAIPLAFAGQILSHSFVVDDPASTPGASITLNLEINATNVTGGVVTLTTATVLDGVTIPGTAITAANVFTAGDTLSVEAVVGTAFTEGSGTITIVIKALGT